jgi:tRNA1(Val) A37 N6-methylase TrmN6
LSEVTEDWLLKEQVRIFQPRYGYRAGMDAVLLAASLAAMPGERLLELGCGAGGALLPAAWRLNECHFTGVERDPVMIPCALRGIEANAVSDRVRIISEDVSRLPADWQNMFDQVFSNPPYFEPGRIQPPHEGKANAYLAETSLQDWLKAMLFAVKPKGRITLIHRAGEVGEILSYLLSRAGQIEVFPVRSAPGEPAKRVIVTARKGLRRGEVVIHAGLTMHGKRGDSAYTASANAVFAGAALKVSDKT